MRKAGFQLVVTNTTLSTNLGILMLCIESSQIYDFIMNKLPINRDENRRVANCREIHGLGNGVISVEIEDFFLGEQADNEKRKNNNLHTLLLGIKCWK